MSHILTALTVAFILQPAFGHEHDPRALTALLNRVEVSAAAGHSPVAIFDLDDTLLDTRERNLRILHDFAAQTSVASQWPEAALRVRNLNPADLKYLLSDTLAAAGIGDADFAQAAQAFWLQNFFTNSYCAEDRPNPGAALYLQLLARAGAKIVFLTGRDIPRMHDGTVASLMRNRFPEDALLIMKPDPKMDDLKFKESQYAAIGALGEVVGVFENEPANINSMALAFPDSDAIFLDTIHSPKPDAPLARVKWVENFNF